MARINLLTIHYGQCYGAIMQTYATCKLLEQAGYKVSVINLIHPRNKLAYLHVKRAILLFREFQFWLFKKRYFAKLTKKIYSAKHLVRLPNADVTIVGSDQVWNRDIVKDFNYAFFLDFVPNNQKKIAFCSSFGKKEWTESDLYTQNIASYFKSFDALSVREDSGVRIMQNVFNLKATQLLDPTLGYGYFDKLVLRKKPIDQIFTFLFNFDEEVRICTEYISAAVHCPLYHRTKFNLLFRSGPQKWLSNIYNSKYIITDSFHGLALSLIFHKQFFVFCANQEKFTRLESLLKLVGLSNRYVKSLSDFKAREEELLRPINYEEVDKVLKKERRKTLDFINSISKYIR